MHCNTSESLHSESDDYNCVVFLDYNTASLSPNVITILFWQFVLKGKNLHDFEGECQYYHAHACAPRLILKYVLIVKTKKEEAKTVILRNITMPIISAYNVPIMRATHI